ncbi:fumarylacetoacetate hydrolase family protein [Yoonia vestfoldensis]|uniref:fumarylacetoacetate hydrolase family protein n=1 Tax=Yoonia vestfoldensis TaxID=245188 RepID=UPI000369C443|nr:fumarylacetoacetate hydrolase family protein [Yoonia vestfoldensis]
MTFDFGDLIVHAVKTLRLDAGTIILSRTLSNKLNVAPITPFLQPGERVQIWTENAPSQSIFGMIDQHVAAL